MKTYLIIIAFFAMFLNACKNDSINPEIAKLRPNSLNSISFSPENPLNPYDTIGERHNLILERVIPGLCASCKPDLNVASNAVLNATAQLKLSTPNRSFYDTVSGTVTLNTDQLVSQLKCSNAAKDMLTRLFDIIKDTEITTTDYTNLKVQIINVEDTTIANQNIGENDKATILSACSVARFSIYYWGYSNPPVKSYTLKGITKWIAAATSDIAGAVVTRSASYAADCSSYAYWLIVYGMPG